MSFKVAIASSDGERIDQHFGSSRQFYMYQIDQETGNFFCIEKRTLEPAAEPVEELTPGPSLCAPDSPSSCTPASSCSCGGNRHEGGVREQAARLVADCRAVLAARIGPGGEKALVRYGIQALEISDTIDSALNKLTRFYQKQSQRKYPLAARAREVSGVLN